MQNKLRALLTSLGIIFGVASVISMMAVGTGAQEAIVEQMRILGANNIIIRPVINKDGGGSGGAAEESEEPEDEAKMKKRWSPGLTKRDVAAIKEVIPKVENVSYEILLDEKVLRQGRKANVNLVGVNGDYFDLTNVELESGNLFAEYQYEHATPVCVIGSAVKTRFFPSENPLNQRLKVGKEWLEVVGVMKSRRTGITNIAGVDIRDFDMDVYSPSEAVLIRYKDRYRENVKPAPSGRGRWWMMINEEEEDDPNYHQLGQITVKLEDGADMVQTAQIIERLLKRRHNKVVDYQVIVPETLLKSKEETENLFSVMLMSIASISLLVGGIGIMNIMLASVMERIKEIGVRLSLGATRQDIILQFLSEATAIAVTGGVIGIFLGFLFSFLIEKFLEYPTTISIPSVFVSFLVALSVGLVFGIIPAKRAADQDPVNSLRYE